MSLLQGVIRGERQFWGQGCSANEDGWSDTVHPELNTVHPEPHIGMPVGVSPSPSCATCTMDLGLHFPKDHGQADHTPAKVCSLQSTEPEWHAAVFVHPCKVNPRQAAVPMK